MKVHTESDLQVLQMDCHRESEQLRLKVVPEKESEQLKAPTESDQQVLQMDCHNHMRNIFVAKTVTNALDPTVSVKASHLASA